MKRFAVIFGILLGSAVAAAVVTQSLKGLVYVKATNTAPTCATATGVGDLCVYDALEANGALDIGGASTLTGDVTINGGTAALTSSAADTTWLIENNDSTALKIGGSGMPNMITFDTRTGQEKVVVIGTTATDTFHVDVGDALFDEDVAIGGNLVVTGTVTAGGVPSTYTAVDDTFYVMGTGSDAEIGYEHTNQVPDTLFVGVSADSNQLLIAEIADVATDMTIAAQTNPTLNIHSADKTDALDYITMAHDQTNGVIGVGQGLVSMPSGTLITDQAYACFGASSDAGIGYNTTQTQDSLWVGVGQDARTVIVAEHTDIANDYAIAQQTNPTLVVHAASATAAHYVALTHNQTDSVLTSATGDLVLQPQGEDIIIGTGEAGQDYRLGVNGETNDGGLTYMEDEDRWDFDASDSVTIGGTLTIAALAGTGATGVGLTAASSANQACDTTCGGSTCFIGWDVGTSVFVACGNAIGDTCICLP